MAPRVEVIPYALPFRRTYRTSSGQIDRREMVLLRLTTEDGLTGLGEAVPMSLRGGESLVRVVDELEAWAGAVMAGEAELPPPSSAPARCAVETANADVLARRAEIPLHALLGQPESRPVRCNATIGADDPEEAADDALIWAEDGFATFKVKAGTGDDAARIEAVRETVGPEASIRIDANGAWTAAEAIENLGILDEYGIELVEQPVSGLEAMAEVRRACGAMVIADESVADEQDAKAARELGACDGVTVKLSKIGGLDASLGEYLPVYLSSALDGPVGIAAAAHVAQTLPTDGPLSSLAQGLATSRLFEHTIAAKEAELSGDRLLVPDGPGLGVEIDESALDRFRL